ncbi:MAG: ABC transporter permease, partial [Longimicrobiales bacterium]
YRAQDRVFEDAAAWWRPEINLVDDAGEPIRVSTVEASENLFDVIGVPPLLGRTFPRDETLYGREQSEAVISHRLWQSRYDGDPAALGRIVRLNGYTHTIVGVMPPGFHFPEQTDVWQRLTWDLAQHSRAAHFMGAVGRLRAGVTPEQANADLQTLTTRLAEENTRTNRGWGVRVTTLGNDVAGVFRPAFLALLGAAGLLLFAACFNVANLLLARGTVRRTEMAVRAALGASRRRLLAQLLTESLVVAVASAVLGFLIAFLAVRAFLAWTPIDIPRAGEIAVNLPVLAFTVGVTLLTAFGFGLAPAYFLSRGQLQQALREGSRGLGAGSGGRRARNALVTVQVALAVVLLAGAGLLVRSVSQLLRVDSGVRPAHVITADIQLPDALYDDWMRVQQFYAQLLESVRAEPGIVAAGAANFLPLEAGWRFPLLIPEAGPALPGEGPQAQYHTIDEGYLDALGIGIVHGRGFDARDDVGRSGVVLINETLARRNFPGQDPVGRRINTTARQIGPLGVRLAEDPALEIVGIVRDVRNTSLDADPEAAVYFPQRQFPFRKMYIYVRGDAAPAALLTTLTDAVRRLDPALPLGNVRQLERVLSAAADPPKLVMVGLGAFAALALLLAAIGVYGVLSYTVTHQRREIGIRMALGARPGETLRAVVRDGLLLGVAGGALGIVAALAAGRALSSLLFGVTAADPLTLAGVFALVIVVTVLSCALPGRRAAATPPMEALRE